MIVSPDEASRIACRNDRRVIEVNRAGHEIPGYASREEFLAVPIEKLYVNPADRKQLSQRLLREGMVTGTELQYRKKDGRKFWAAVSARSISTRSARPDASPAMSGSVRAGCSAPCRSASITSCSLPRASRTHNVR